MAIFEQRVLENDIIMKICMNTKLPFAERIFLITLARLVDDEGKVTIRRQALSLVTGIKLVTLLKNREKLVQKGLLSYKPYETEEGFKIPHEYTLNIDKIMGREQ